MLGIVEVLGFCTFDFKAIRVLRFIRDIRVIRLLGVTRRDELILGAY